jgi:hypothetical protein
MPSKKKSKKGSENSAPKLETIIADFTRDLSNTFPEYSYLWSKWTQPLDQEELTNLHQYFYKVMPERFFDILYQNEDIFLPTSEINTFFLPNVEFKLLYNCDNITTTTKDAIWKYLQLILFTLTPSLKDKTPFGDAQNLFDGIDESELQSKITEAISGIGDFFKNIRKETAGQEEGGQEEAFQNCEGEPREKYNMPNPNNIFDNLKSLFDGKIGKLAKELAEEMSDEFKEIFGNEGGVGADPKDVFKKLMKDPKKIMNLVQKLSTKLKSKFESGEVNQDDMMREASQFMKQFKDMGGAGSEQFKEMFQNMTKGMGLGKNAKMDVNALARMEKQMDMRERMKRNVEKKRAEQEASNIKMVNGTPVFQLDGGEKQEKSSKEDIDKLMKEMGLENEVVNASSNTNNKKKKKAKK